jgi:hypothetical protein
MTEHCARALLLGSPGFKYRPGDWLAYGVSWFSRRLILVQLVKECAMFPTAFLPRRSLMLSLILTYTQISEMVLSAKT